MKSLLQILLPRCIVWPRQYNRVCMAIERVRTAELPAAEAFAGQQDLRSNGCTILIPAYSNWHGLGLTGTACSKRLASSWWGHLAYACIWAYLLASAVHGRATKQIIYLLYKQSHMLHKSINFNTWNVKQIKLRAINYLAHELRSL